MHLVQVFPISPDPVDLTTFCQGKTVMFHSSISAIHRLGLGLAIALAVTIVAIVTSPASAELGAASKFVPSAELVGKGRLTYFGFRVFDASLYAPKGQYSASKPFALKLTYLRNFKGSAITSRTVKEMKRQGMSEGNRLKSWEKQMNAIFPNVRPGQSITGVRTSGGNTEFFLGDRKIGTIKGREFTRRFFAIWLGSNTNDPGLRAQLVGARS